MKLICSLLAFIVLTLSVQPVCASIATKDNCCTENTCGENADKQDDAHKECTGTCNPFQICGCCSFGVVPTIQPVFSFAPELKYVNPPWAILNCPYVETPVIGIWQPPKLS